MLLGLCYIFCLGNNFLYLERGCVFVECEVVNWVCGGYKLELFLLDINVLSIMFNYDNYYDVMVYD